MESEIVPWLDTYHTMWSLCSVLTTNELIMRIQCSSMSEVHGNIDTSPCRSNIQPQPKGNEGLAALVGLAHASRAGVSHPQRWDSAEKFGGSGR